MKNTIVGIVLMSISYWTANFVPEAFSLIAALLATVCLISGALGIYAVWSDL